MDSNPVRQLTKLGQSVWLDLLSRNLIRSGQLQRLIDEDGLTGVTSNPAIFEKAIGGSADYDADIRKLADSGKDASQIYRELAIGDIQEAADRLRPIYDRTEGTDGYVSLEVSPLLANDTAATIQEARDLWNGVSRPNVMIKIPATLEGLPAITQSIADGININVTLIFGVPRYQAVADAYITGLEQRAQLGRDLRSVRSVASFFLSRIDVLIDPKLKDREQGGSDAAELAPRIRGQVAIASARIAYQLYKEIVSSERFRKLEKKGARRQWLLWGSTSTKTEGESDVKYVEALIGTETVNTMPMETLEAYRDHGNPEPRLENDLDHAHQVMSDIKSIGFDIDELTQELEEEGVEKFVKPFEKLLRGLAEKTKALQTA